MDLDGTHARPVHSSPAPGSWLTDCPQVMARLTYLSLLLPVSACTNCSCLKSGIPPPFSSLSPLIPHRLVYSLSLCWLSLLFPQALLLTLLPCILLCENPHHSHSTFLSRSFTLSDCAGCPRLITTTYSIEKRMPPVAVERLWLRGH